ncbi:MAG TPA: pyridoxal-dependent decarboxylase [Gemmatimonadales bacterium]|nr:pyridoxal-dependent decarboxylase [Gemmatimonadales bacterium]
MPSSSRPDEALHSWFLGPRAENADLLERLVTEALRDHVFWRRNYHPEDAFVTRETDKRREGYEDAVATLTQELMGLLAALKRDIPFFSGRYKGHMIFQQTIASQVGYFAAMLYNPNNIAAEAAPVTTRMELEVAAQLAAMIGYDPASSWGHLTSGGTVANFEALWIARNLHYLSVACAGAARELGVGLDVVLPTGDRVPLASLTLPQLLNIDNGAALDLWDALWASAPRADVHRAFDHHSLATLGYQDCTLRLAEQYGDPLPAAVVLVASTGHYSWEKITRALGIGSSRLVFVPVDSHFRLDPDALWEQLRSLTGRRVPVLACVSVCGSTEESAVDRLDLVAAVRERARKELGIAFHLHSDACYGGYAASVLWKGTGTRRSAAEIRRATGTPWPEDHLVRSIEALARTDSVTIDPHKLGYIPYPAGAFLLRDRRGRELVSVDPPYLVPPEGASGLADELFLGRSIFEGSKPGAAAAAVWLSHKVLPLDARGYGYLVERTAVGARMLHDALGRMAGQFSVLMLPEPDINIVCFIVRHPALTTLAELNDLNEGIYRRMSLGHGGPAPEYIITRTRFQTPMYDGAIAPIIDALGIGSVETWRASADEGLVVLRSTVMDPFLATTSGAEHVAGFVRAVERAASEALLDAGSVR